MGVPELPENPPSYEEIMLEGPSDAPAYTPTASQSQQRPSGRPSQPARPSSSTSLLTAHHHRPSGSSSSRKKPEDLYTANLKLPWRYPSNHYCRKCKNTGYKLKNGKQCKDCWKIYAPTKYYGVTEPQLNNILKPQHKPRPTVAPVHNGPRPQIIPLRPGTTLVPAQMPMMPGGPMMHPGPMMPPRVVRPGDPAIGGTLCPRCRGRGLVSFFLDEETCGQCNGIGRVFYN